MQVAGYKKCSDEYVELQEASLVCGLEELEKVICFLQYVKEKHGTEIMKIEYCHSHYRDWDKSWNTESTDIIVITNIDKC